MKTLFYIILTFLIVTSAWLFLYSLHYYYMLYIYYKKSRKWKNDHNNLDLKLPDELPVVTIQLPIYNEMFVAERIIYKVAELDYPKNKLKIQVLDDSTDETKIITKRAVDDLRKKNFNIKWFHREIRTGYKGGALKDALEFCEGDFIAILDADFLPSNDFLLKALPHFNDEKIAVVQCRWVFMNPDYSLLTKLQKITMDGHFLLEQNGRFNSQSYFSFNGSAGLWRKQAIYDAGNWSGDTLTEDLDLSYRAQFKGWKFKFVSDIEVKSELPVLMSGFKSQQFRWANGFIQNLKKLVKPVLKSEAKFIKKFEALTHISSHLSYMVMALHLVLSLPMVILMKDHYHLVENSFLFFFLGSIMTLGMSAPLIFLFIGQKIQGKPTCKTLLKLPFLFLINFGLIIHLSKAVWQGLTGKKLSFIRTPKYNIKDDKDKKMVGKKYKSVFDSSTIAEIFAILYSLTVLILAIKFKVYFMIGICLAFISGLSMIAGTSLYQHFKLKRNSKELQNCDNFQNICVIDSNLNKEEYIENNQSNKELKKAL